MVKGTDSVSQDMCLKHMNIKIIGKTPKSNSKKVSSKFNLETRKRSKIKKPKNSFQTQFLASFQILGHKSTSFLFKLKFSPFSVFSFLFHVSMITYSKCHGKRDVVPRDKDQAFNIGQRA